MDAGIKTGPPKAVNLVVQVFANLDSLTALFRSWSRPSPLHLFELNQLIKRKPLASFQISKVSLIFEFDK
jgi:hypothetical protein